MRSSRSCEAAGVDTVFGIPGLHTLPFYDALAGTPSIRHILTRHEQGAAFAADGYARTLGRPGVLSTTTGPGTFNTLAAFAEAWSDSSPIVLLAGQIDAALDGLGRGVLHETPDQGRSFEAVTAYVGRPRTPEAIPAAVAEALCRSMAGRPRPAYVEMPTDIVGARVHRRRRRPSRCPGRVAPDPDSIVAAARLLDGARRIVIMPGAGVHRANASRELRELAIRLGAPVATAVTGAGSIAADDDWCAGSVVAGRPEWTAALHRRRTPWWSSARGSTTWAPRAGRCRCRTSSTSTSIRPSSTAPTRRRSAIVGDARLALRGLLDELGVGAGRSVGRSGLGRRASPGDARGVRCRRGARPARRPRRVPGRPGRDAARRDPDPRRGAAELLERLLLAGLRARRIDLAVGLGDARLRPRRRERRGRRGPRPAGRGHVRRRRLPVHRDASSRRRPRTAST